MLKLHEAKLSARAHRLHRTVLTNTLSVLRLESVIGLRRQHLAPRAPRAPRATSAHSRRLLWHDCFNFLLETVYMCSKQTFMLLE